VQTRDFDWAFTFSRDACLNGVRIAADHIATLPLCGDITSPATTAVMKNQC